MGFKSRVSLLVCFYFLTNASSTLENNTKGKGVEHGRSKEDCADLEADVDPNFPDNQAKNEEPGSGSSSNSTFSQGADYYDASVKNLRRQKCKKSLKRKRCKKTQNTKWHSARSFKKRNNRREFGRSEKGTSKLKRKKTRSQRQISTGSMKRKNNKKQVHPLLKVISNRGQYRSIKHVFIRNRLYNSEAY